MRKLGLEEVNICTQGHSWRAVEPRSELSDWLSYSKCQKYGHEQDLIPEQRLHSKHNGKTGMGGAMANRGMICLSAGISQLPSLT